MSIFATFKPIYSSYSFFAVYHLLCLLRQCYKPLNSGLYGEMVLRNVEISSVQMHLSWVVVVVVSCCRGHSAEVELGLTSCTSTVHEATHTEHTCPLFFHAVFCDYFYYCAVSAITWTHRNKGWCIHCGFIWKAWVLFDAIIVGTCLIFKILLKILSSLPFVGFTSPSRSTWAQGVTYRGKKILINLQIYCTNGPWVGHSQFISSSFWSK